MLDYNRPKVPTSYFNISLYSKMYKKNTYYKTLYNYTYEIRSLSNS